MPQIRIARFPKSLFSLGFALAIGGVLVAFAASVTMAAEQGMVPKEGAVKKTYNKKPFEYQAKMVAEKDAYRVFRVTYPSPIETEYEQNNTIPADYFLPKGIKPGERRPAVVCLHILHGRFELVNMVCSALAARGVPAIMIKLPYYGERQIPGGFSSLRRKGDLFSAGLLQGLEDIRRTVDFLESRPEVDSKRLGVTGLSLGAIVSARVAADEPRFGKVVIVFGGGDLPYIIDNANETRTIREYLAKLSPEERKTYGEKIRQIDPLTHAVKLKDRAKAGNVVMYNGAVDETITPRSAKKLAAAMGMEDKIRWYEGVGHYTFFDVLPDMLAETVEFFADDVPKPEAKLTDAPVTVAKKTPEEAVVAADKLVSNWFNQLHKVLGVEPKPGCYHEVDLTAQSSSGGKNQWQGRLRYARGSGSRFKLQLDLVKPLKAQLAIGYDEFPWIASPEKGVVFCGTQESEVDKKLTLDGPLAGVRPEYLKNWGMVKGVISVIAMSPGLLEQLAKIEDVPTTSETKAEERRQIRITPHQKVRGNVLLSCEKCAKTIDRLDVDIQGYTGNICFAQLCTDAPEEESPFAPSTDLKRVEVERDAVFRIISSTVNFLMERVR